jgi:hypothetical protein
METKKRFLNICLASLFLLTPVLAEAEETDAIVSKPRHELVNGQVSTIFEVTAPVAGRYYLGLWTMPLWYNDLEKYSSFEVVVNNAKLTETIEFSIGDWQSVTFSNTVALNEGANKVAFVTTGDAFPMIDYVRLSLDPEKVAFSSQEYEDFLAWVQSQQGNGDYEDEDSTIVDTDEQIEDVLRAGTTSVEAASAGSFSVAQTAPGVASISLTLAKDAKVSLSVVDLKGRAAATLLNGARLPAGRSDYAVSLPQGLYLVVYNLSGTTQVKKIAVK